MAPTLADLQEFRPDVGKSLRQLLAYDAGDDEDVLGLTFSGTEEICAALYLLSLGNSESYQIFLFVSQ